VTHLTLGENFDQFLSLGSIPDSVTHLAFGYYFNQPLIVNCIPNSVTHLTLNEKSFNLNKNFIPKSVLYLNNKKIKN
jgi:hypothetical protein